MSDISQHGLICTLQRLNENPALEGELAELTRDRPVALILPCHFGEISRPALADILAELSRARFISEVLIPMNGTDSAGFSTAKAYFRDRLALRHRVLHCDRLLTGETGGCEDVRTLLPGFQPGKGSNVWLATGVLIREGAAAFVLTTDADVTTFRLEMLARLAFALAHPDLGYTFAKSYYPRVTERIYGRVSRLFMAPLLQAVTRVSGHQPLLDFLRSFRYPLAGECGLTARLAGSLPLDSGWGLEVGMLCELFKRIEPREVCQVDAGGRYDHKHQPLGDGARGLFRMCREIATTLFGHLALEGFRLDQPFFEAVAACYRREAAEALRRSAALARINALQFNLDEEREALGSFESALQESFSVRGSDGANAFSSPLPGWAGAGGDLLALLERMT